MKTTLITGCSSGFGMLTAIRLASSGYSGLAIQSSLTIILEKEKVINFANKNNLFIVSI